MRRMYTIDVIPYSSQYAEQTVEMWRNSKEKAIGQKEIHSFDNHIDYLNQILYPQFRVELAVLNQQVVGMIAYNDHEISQLYIHVDYQGQGIGVTLLERAKIQSAGKLTLYTFDVNKNAQKFYEKHGFRIIGRSHDNEEGLLDILYEWVR
ncbi:GNAT family N-acetyltransferase [Ureibacillus aquaedulcis]|uniref:GNAT family N-acetyltransferase n=1 Tax=Ureibacillus aquaedulcis TaxID=3058421 RepID=A0ABT8GV34_9BACL|nr:GNAT family N-acetyltransferase [Ureibacillus sp. BA0131]MDN4495265.1 GNAT family N-acetyltransferase [Ureibacillus sp. BA0131]